ncbi:MAG TPA: metallophosphoesterase [bacterium]|nr:metallophosphoesterase [bacterium]
MTECAQKIGIMSDSHDNLPAIRAAVDFFNIQQVDLVIHAGDLVAPFTARELKKLRSPYEIVLGNNDGEILGLHHVYAGKVHLPPFKIRFANKNILVLHDAGILSEIKQQTSYDMIIYGHDHQSAVDRLPDGTWIVNPGECGGWLYGESTIAIYDIQQDQVTIHKLEY